MIDERVGDAYLHIIAKVTAGCERMLGTPCQSSFIAMGMSSPTAMAFSAGGVPCPDCDSARIHRKGFTE